LLNWQNETILNREGIQSELVRLQSGKGFSPQLKRAAMDGRARTPAEFLEGQMKRYGMTITPKAMKHLQEISSAETTPLRYVATAANAAYPVLARASMWALDAITGTQPSIAAGMPAGGMPAQPQRLISFNPYRRPAARSTAPSGGGGGRWDRGPAVAIAHPETGSGYTVPGGRDSKGRPVVFGRSAANAFAAMVRDSGGIVKASDIASSQRSASKNAAVGGAPKSKHLGGNAMDIHGASHDWIEKNGARYGWYLHRYGGPGDHGGHFEFRGN
jgi:hypothetical protein